MPSPTVLIVDDSTYARTALRGLVEDKFRLCVCGEACNGVEALDMANRYKPDLVVMDLLMPIANGVESASAMRSTLPETRIVIVTMYPELIGQSVARMAGIDAVIDKTKCAAGLTSALQTFFGESELPSIQP
jgi:DNA-binding NarL/FixJ family response regulator